nr:ATP-dependent Clp protease ATP-binding subunit ClpA homolog CD4B, chloroplastic [Ipomoea batatas]
MIHPQSFVSEPGTHAFSQKDAQYGKETLTPIAITKDTYPTIVSNLANIIFVLYLVHLEQSRFSNICGINALRSPAPIQCGLLHHKSNSHSNSSLQLSSTLTYLPHRSPFQETTNSLRGGNALDTRHVLETLHSKVVLNSEMDPESVGVPYSSIAISQHGLGAAIVGGWKNNITVTKMPDYIKTVKSILSANFCRSILNLTSVLRRAEHLVPDIPKPAHDPKGLGSVTSKFHHKLRYTDEALVAAAQLSYQTSAIDLVMRLDSRVLDCPPWPGSQENLRKAKADNKEKNEASQSNFEEWCRQMNLIDCLNGRNTATDESWPKNEAVKAISRAIDVLVLAKEPPSRLYQLHFSGPTGVGKSETG